ncbi:MAG: hypothetical protein G01um101466_669 [Parcubacteria group bacterium Gr01-1014_66]|nr:MAG: hypothetical protein G01um101466_669 [Parcubacteria group bacterium Gr01-1014_66]
MRGSRALPYHLKDESTPRKDSLYTFSATAEFGSGFTQAFPDFTRFFNPDYSGKPQGLRDALFPGFFLFRNKVPGPRVELGTPASSGQRSTAELTRRFVRKLSVKTRKT